MPWDASTRRTAPSQAARDRLTSYPKSTWPGVSMRWRVWSFQGTRTFWALMVIPRSRSMSIESRYCSRISRGSTAPVSSRIRSDRVDLPWSTWLMIEKFRMRSTGSTEGPAYLRWGHGHPAVGNSEAGSIGSGPGVGPLIAVTVVGVLVAVVVAIVVVTIAFWICLLYTSDAADEEDSVDLGGR